MYTEIEVYWRGDPVLFSDRKGTLKAEAETLTGQDVLLLTVYRSENVVGRFLATGYKGTLRPAD